MFLSNFRLFSGSMFGCSRLNIKNILVVQWLILWIWIILVMMVLFFIFVYLLGCIVLVLKWVVRLRMYLVLCLDRLYVVSFFGLVCIIWFGVQCGQVFRKCCQIVLVVLVEICWLIIECVSVVKVLLCMVSCRFLNCGMILCMMWLCFISLVLVFFQQVGMIRLGLVLLVFWLVFKLSFLLFGQVVWFVFQNDVGCSQLGMQVVGFSEVFVCFGCFVCFD